MGKFNKDNCKLLAELYIDDDGEAHLICHTKDEDFLGTKDCFIKFITLLKNQLVDEKQCPFYKSE